MKGEKMDHELKVDVIDDEMVAEVGLRSVNSLKARDAIAPNFLHHGLAKGATIALTLNMQNLQSNSEHGKDVDSALVQSKAKWKIIIPSIDMTEYNFLQVEVDQRHGGATSSHGIKN
ncbi:nuclease HARBI1-like protein [Trifolium pratense]|uniref:Nuclease HARBI1-like protein n=1 Tax=Trifolium pratense TaxID=57577 RepID=A0A2K3MJI8_TRIPR|nr:nuclease HARBI1-like protein [Trifolium pratense]